jgi:hypothetical protein
MLASGSHYLETEFWAGLCWSHVEDRPSVSIPVRPPFQPGLVLLIFGQRLFDFFSSVETRLRNSFMTL